MPLEQVVVVYDDLDLALGTARLRAKGGTGGHNGMRSITQRLGGNTNFPRLRIGIGRPTTSIPIASYVLQVGRGRASVARACHAVRRAARR